MPKVCRLSGKMEWDNDYLRVEPAFASGKVVKTSNIKHVWSGPLKHSLIPQSGAVSHVDFCNEKPSLLAVTSSTKVVVYNAHMARQYTHAKFKDKAYCGTFRNDGHLLAAGGEDGLVQVFDPENFGTLRTFRGHLKPVHCVSFRGITSSLLSGGDDGTLRSWDIATGVATACADSAHDDYIRSLTVMNELSVCATGSYDHHCKIWDPRSSFSMHLAKFKHDAPVEAVSLSSSGTILVSAAGTHVYFWDITANKLMQKFSLHQKTITSLTISSAPESKFLLISGSLDGSVKISNFEDCRLLSSLRYSSPVLCCDLASDGHALGVGMSDGMLSVKQQKHDGHAGVHKEQRSETPFASGHDYFVRGKNTRPGASDFIVEGHSKRRLREYDNLMKGFRFKEALQAALKTRRTDIFLGCLDNLLSRGNLKTALSGMDESFLPSVLDLAGDSISNASYSQAISTFLSLFLDEALRGKDLYLNKDVLFRLKALHDKIRNECQVQNAFLVVKGMIESLVS